jgi:flagellar export protein FliJ
MDRHDTWSVLSVRADGQVEVAARALVRSQEAVDRVELTRQKLHRLMQDCLQEQTASHPAAVALGDRRNAVLFIAQLQAMEDGLQQTLQAAQTECNDARARLAQAQVDAHKARHLLDQATRARRDSRSRQEQARLDEWTTLRHSHARAGSDTQPDASTPVVPPPSAIP